MLGFWLLDLLVTFFGMPDFPSPGSFSIICPFLALTGFSTLCRAFCLRALVREAWPGLSSGCISLTGRFRGFLFTRVGMRWGLLSNIDSLRGLDDRCVQMGM